MHLIDFNIFVQQMHNIFIHNQLFLIELPHVSVLIHHPQGASYYVMLKLLINKMAMVVQVVVTKNWYIKSIKTT
jgi:hypothetical protein